ncbi:hypothetical protein PORY_000984 [Pneumocystis oryctolagi]|uniref:Uncharacterized protein n=1 Tax=Pneumocystis oryctolagi TaxID=42067 RepID=A0ACB7CCX9_9ASCO|nr:hypothetical protein PORY_000984 [Pneumocystis oryctolagi]
MDANLDANEKARLRRKARQDRILGHESERLTKIVQVSYPKSAFEAKKTVVSDEISSKIRNQKKDEFGSSQAQNMRGTLANSEEPFPLNEEIFNAMSSFGKKMPFPSKDSSGSIFHMLILFLRDMFFSCTEDTSPNSFFSPENPSEPLVLDSRGERWLKWVHFIWITFLLFKIVLKHSGFLGTLEDRLGYMIAQPIFYYFVITEWILYTTLRLFFTRSANQSSIYPFLKTYFPSSIQPYLQVLFYCQDLWKRLIWDISLLIFTLGALSWWNHFYLF